MSQKLYVGNLPFSATEEDVKIFFASFGTVKSVSIITDRETGRPRGFGFVEMEDAQQALAANGKEMSGRKLMINEARERSSR